MIVICAATELRPPVRGDAAALVRVAADAGAAGIFVGAGCLLDDLGTVAAAALTAGLAVPGITLPLPDRLPAPGKRIARLAAPDGDERDAAIALAGEALAAGAAAGARYALLDFGPVALQTPRAEVARFFRRREIDDDEPGAARLEAAVAERKARASALIDACHWAIERLGRAADGRGMTLLLPIGATPWEIPSPREGSELLEAFRGAPLAPAWDPGRLSALRALGLPLSDGRAEALAAAAGAAVENDAVGMDAGYLPGLGERDERLPARAALPAGGPVIVTGTPDTTDAEITDSVRAATARYGA